ncbi:hypothetical protein C8Q72DRAFT_881260 [Fomitopsis betulina]|nr:hypothetical protein C8Q72DRAFT_881260 [Fomitopsis betulina]
MLGQTRELTLTLSSLLVRLQGALSPPTSMPVIPEDGGVNVNTVPKPAKGTKSSGSSRPRELARNGSYSH